MYKRVKIADLLNARWVEMMEKLRTESPQEREKKYVYVQDSNPRPSDVSAAPLHSGL